MRARVLLMLLSCATALPAVAQDIIATSVTGPATVGVGTSAQITLTIRRTGTAPIPNGWIAAAYLSTDGTITATDYLVGAVAGPGTISTTATTLTIPLIVPIWLTPGTYRFGARVDINNVVAETSESNNAAVSGPVTLTGPDLTPSALSGPAAVTAAQSAALTYTVQNLGPGDANSGWKARFFLSSDATITTADVNIGEYTETEILPAGTMKTVTRTLTLPTDLLTGTRYYGVIVDAANQLVEANETNNARASATTVAVTGYPDLKPVSFFFSGTVTAGTPASLQLTVRNQGGVTVPAGWTGNVLLSALPANPTLGQIAAVVNSGAPVDLVVGSFTETADIPPNTSLTTTKTIGMPLGYAGCTAGSCGIKPLDGAYYFEVRLDVSNAVAEGLETNNDLKGPYTTGVIQPPDLVPTLITGPASATVGTQISVNTRVDNIGAGPASGGWRGTIYLVGAAGPIMVHQYIENAVTLHGTPLISTKTFFLPASVTPGSYQLRFVVDDAGTITEANSTHTGEANNTLDGGTIVVSP